VRRETLFSRHSSWFCNQTRWLGRFLFAIAAQRVADLKRWAKMGLHKYEEITAALGDIAIAFQSLEQSVAEAFSALLKSDGMTTGQIIASQLSFQKLVLVFESLFRYRVKDRAMLVEVKLLTKESMNLEAERNRYFHSYYDLREIMLDQYAFDKVKRTLKMGRGLKHQSELFDPAKAVQLAADMRTLSRKFDVLLNRLIESSIVPDYHWSPE
jgi:hypothetical protein